jgi:F0F1-type ATP synthase assembly protein I
MEKPNTPNSNSKSAQALSMGLELGFMIALPLIIFLVAGVFIDKKFGTLPLFTIVALVLNMIFTIFNVKKIILPFLEKRSQKNNNN